MNKETDNRISLLTALGPKQRLKLSMESPARPIRRREQLYLPGEPADTLFLIQSGRVKLSRCSAEGREVILSILGPGDVFGLETVLGQESRASLAVALEAGRVLMIGRERFQSLVAEHPGLMMVLLRIVNERLMESHESLSRLVFHDVKGRLAALLLELAGRQGRAEDGGIRLEAPVTHQDLANLIGSTRETTTAMLNQFRRQQLIQFDRRRIVISGWDGLRALAAG